jgi:hypothetical protein
VAIEARLDLPKAASRLEALSRYGLAEQDQSKRWRVTGLGRVCAFETVPDRPGRRDPVGPLGQRLLALLDRPMRGSAVMEELGISCQLFRQMVIKLHAQGRLRFGDPKRPSWFVMRADDVTPLLSCNEERVLAAVPFGDVADFGKIARSARLSAAATAKALERLLDDRFVEAVEDGEGEWAYRLTAVGAKHPQRG